MKIKNKIIGFAMVSSLLLPSSCYALEKSETIYSTLDYNGKYTNTTVSNHLSFIDSSKIEDETALKNILNIGGNETFTLNGNQLEWNTQNKDIYYEGETDQELPILTNIHYFLNDEEKDAKEMLGSSGNITIRLQFQNLDKKTVQVNGKDEVLYTPFVTTIGTLLNSKYNKNISISNGRVVSTGTRNMVIGLSSPGLYDSLHFDELKSLDEIVISYETTKFELNNIYIVSTPKLLETSDLEIFDKMDELYSNVSELQRNMNVLENGILELSLGIESLNQGSLQLMNSLKSLQSGVKKLQSGSVSLRTGLKDVLKALQNTKKELESADMSSLSSINTLKSQNENTIKSLIHSTGMSEEELKQAYVTHQLSAYKGTDANLLALKNAYELITLLRTNTTALTTTVSTITTLNSKLNALITTLDGAITKLEDGASSLSSGIETLKSGIDKIYDGSLSLNTGAKQLNTGAKTLSAGASKFNKDGVGTLNRYAYTLKNYSDKMEALTELSNDYHGFSSNNSNQTVFISKVQSLKVVYEK